MHSMVRGLGGAIDGVATGKPIAVLSSQFAFAQTLNDFLHALISFQNTSPSIKTSWSECPAI